MRHLFPSRVSIMRGQSVNNDGVPGLTWAEVKKMYCRLDLVFRRPGRDDLGYAVESGRAPDRMGVMFCDPKEPLTAGDRLVCLSGPVHGTFEINTIPDEVPGMSATHHLECTIREVSQMIQTVAAL